MASSSCSRLSSSLSSRWLPQGNVGREGGLKEGDSSSGSSSSSQKHQHGRRHGTRRKCGLRGQLGQLVVLAKIRLPDLVQRSQRILEALSKRKRGTDA